MKSAKKMPAAMPMKMSKDMEKGMGKGMPMKMKPPKAMGKSRMPFKPTKVKL